MARRNKKQMNKNIIKISVCIIILIIGIFSGKYFIEDGQIKKANINIEENFYGSSNDNAYENIQNENSTDLNGEKIKIYYLDVGQADSILLTSNNESMLIDAGTNEAGTTVVNDLKSLGITKLNYIVGTHPHEDHIGGLDDVIKAFDIGTVFMPKIQSNTKTFESVLDAISSKGLKITSPEKGYTFKVGNIDCEIMLCGSGTTSEQKSNLNLSSIVIRASYGEQSYLFTGDAESENEATRTWPQTNVLKVGHHGSSTSSSKNFLNQVKPQIAIISVGKGNTYGHPTQTTLNNLQNIGAKIYRTDESGTITITSDGKENIVTTEK